MSSLGGYYIVRSKDFVYNPRISTSAPVGPINSNKLGRIGVMSPLYTVFRPHDIDTTYLEDFFKSRYWHPFMNFNGDSGARSDRFSIKDSIFFEMPIPIPHIDEQRRIGEYLTHLDHLITLHQSKRFEYIFVDVACHTLSWEQRKLGELATCFEYGLNVAAKEYDGENKYIRITDIDDESHEFRQDNLTSPDTDLSVFDKYKLSDGDLLLSRTGASVGKSYIYKASDGLVYYAGFLIRARIKEENNSEFVYQNTLTSKYVNFIKVTSMRSGQPGVNAQEYSQFEIMIPSKAEQDTITYYFSNLDHLITLHQLEPYYLIFKAIAYRIIDYAEYKPF